MLSSKNAFSELKRQYHIVLSKNNYKDFMPIKVVTIKGMKDSVATITETYMQGTTLNGFTVEKEILVDDEHGETRESVLLRDYIGKALDEHKDDNFTPFRCGIMTCIAVDEACRLLNVNCKDLAVGFIGNGNVNQHNAKALQEVFGLRKCVIHGSRKNRGKNKEKFPSTEVDKNCELLNECDVIISCTSGCDGKDMINIEQLTKPRIFIALDGGYTLDESFRRECDCFSDYVDQQEEYYEEEFPFDENKYKLKQLCRDTIFGKSRICVYLFGIGFADAVIAEAMYNGKKE